MALYDPNKKRAVETGTQIGRLTLIPGSGADRLAKGVGGFLDNVAAKRERFERNTAITAPLNTGLPSSVGKPVTTPARNSAVSAVGGGGSTPAGGVPSPPAVVKPDFSGARGTLVAPPGSQPTGIQRSVVNGVPTYTGTGSFAAPPATAPVTQGVQRPAVTDPRIAQVGAPGIVNQTEDRGQRDERQAALGALDLQDFLLRNKNTRSARDAVSDNARVRADLVNTAGNQAAQLKTANLDAQTRLDAVGMQNQGENDRAVIDQRGQNERAALLDAGATERDRIKLERPSLLTDREGGYHLVNPAQGIARPVLSDGQQVRGLVEGAITPVDRLASLQDELAASQASLTPNPVRNDALERQIDALRRPNTLPLPGDVVNGYRFRGGDPSIAANWQRLEGAP